MYLLYRVCSTRLAVLQPEVLLTKWFLRGEILLARRIHYVTPAHPACHLLEFAQLDSPSATPVKLIAGHISFEVPKKFSRQIIMNSDVLENPFFMIGHNLKFPLTIGSI